MAPKALLSVSDKTGLIPLAKALTQIHGFDLISSGGTAKAIEDAILVLSKRPNQVSSQILLARPFQMALDHLHQRPSHAKGLFDLRSLHRNQLGDHYTKQEIFTTG